MRRILLVSHYTEVPGVMDKLALYLKRRNFSLAFILNPLHPQSSLKSIIRLNNKDIVYKIFWPFQYILEGIICAVKYKDYTATDIDLAICFDPLSFLNSYVFKRFYKIKKIVYYNVDYSRRRFKSKILDFIYSQINKFAYKRCDYFFSITKEFIKDIDRDKKFINKTFLLRHTVNISNKNKSPKKIPKSIVFAGSISNTVNFYPLIKALELVKERKVDFRFDIYGKGDKEKKLKELVRKSIIKNNVKFKEVVSNEMLLNKVLPKYMIGVCPYITQNNNIEDHMFTGTDLTTKIVEYIGSGLPIVTTRLYSAFDVIEKNRFGFLVYSPKEWYTAIKKLLLDKNLYTRHSNNALNFAKNYDEEKVLTPIFDKILQDF